MGKVLIGVAAEDGVLRRHLWRPYSDVNAATDRLRQSHLHYQQLQPWLRGDRHRTERSARGLGDTGIASHVSTSVYLNGPMFGSDNRDLVCLNPNTGEIVWRAPGLEKGGAVESRWHDHRPLPAPLAADDVRGRSRDARAGALHPRL